MAAWPGPGPVFVYEWTSAARRFRTYLTRAFFGFSLLAAMLVGVWSFQNGRAWPPSGNDLAILARFMYYAIVGVQIGLLLLAAPAATAGAICVDKARGTLAHVLTTDLSNAEIVLGKLAARLIPVLSLIASSLPIVMLCSLFGGIDPSALSGAYSVMLGVALLGCSLALFLSVWAKKTHEVLLAVYLFWTIVLLSHYVIIMLISLFGGSLVDWFWLQNFDPFDLAFATYNRPGSTDFWDFAWFFLGCCVLSAIFVTLAVVRVRLVANRDKVQKRRRLLIAFPARWKERIPKFARIRSFLPSPSLDGNPILWREWHRNRPSRWARIVWAVYGTLALAMTVVSAYSFLNSAPNIWSGAGYAAWTNGLQVAIGILLLCVQSSTSLSEERERGSLDILMSTPISTWSIVWGKWLGGFRGVPALTVLPTGLAIILAAKGPNHGWWHVVMIFGLILAYGAWASSMGLALATWVRRLGRAVAVAVTVDVLVTVGWIFLVMALIQMSPRNEAIMMVSHFFGPGELTFECAGPGPQNNVSTAFVIIILYLIASAAIVLATYLSFNWFLGRITLRKSPERDVIISRHPSWLRRRILRWVPSA